MGRCTTPVIEQSGATASALLHFELLVFSLCRAGFG
jgi:hypothetical protein